MSEWWHILIRRSGALHKDESHRRCRRAASTTLLFSPLLFSSLLFSALLFSPLRHPDEDPEPGCAAPPCDIMVMANRAWQWLMIVAIIVSGRPQGAPRRAQAGTTESGPPRKKPRAARAEASRVGGGGGESQSIQSIDPI